MGFFKRDSGSSCSFESNVDTFKCIPKDNTAFCIWKIEDLRIISLSQTKMGTFLTNAAYLLYAASDKDGPLPYPNMPTKELKDKAVVRAIHFWVGMNCDVKVSGAAARAAAELDSQVGATILMREAQGRESPRFHAYFRQSSISVEEQPYEDGHKCTIHRVSGAAVPVLTELRPADWSNFSSHDVILVDVQSRSTMFLWLGSKSDTLHKSHALRLLDEQRKGINSEGPRIFVVEDGYEQTLQPEACKLFNEVLDLSGRIVSQEPLIEKHSSSVSVKLYKCNEQNGKYKVAELKSAPIFRSELESEAVFLLERGEAGVWAWVGKDASAKERLEAVRNARGFVKKKGYGASVPVARALETQEPPEMRLWVRGWSRPRARPFILPSKFEPEFMAERPRTAAECQLIDDGGGEKTLWRIDRQTGFNLIEDQGIFYAEACYALRYKYEYGRRSRTIIYYWEGVQSSGNDRLAAIEAVCNLAEEESAQLIITSQGKEPSHLLQMHSGKLIILSGPHRNSPPAKYLVRVYGTTSYTSKAVERPLRASSLDSRGVFVLFSNMSMVWCGNKSTGDNREASRRLAPLTAPLMCEGKENDEFWAQLGGKGVCNTESSDYEEKELETHFYHFCIEKSTFIGEEVLGFTQNSLIPEAAWLLDTGNVIWIWIGSYCTAKPLQKYIEEGKIFLYTHPASRDRNTTISIIKQGLEPPTFIGLFDNWNYNFLRDYKSLNILQTSSQEQHLLIKHLIATKITSEFTHFVKYPLRILKSDPEKLPLGVDVSRKEMHLTFDDFMSVFKMNPIEFEKLPTWRRQRLKQTAGLF